MELRKNAKIETGEFWYDLFDGGYIDPEEILENQKDIDSVLNAIDVLNKFRSACEDIIEYI